MMQAPYQRLGDADAQWLHHQIERNRRVLVAISVALWILVALTVVAVYVLLLINQAERARLL